MRTIEQLQRMVHQTAWDSGWWPKKENGTIDYDQISIPEKIALIHSEITEAFEEYRDDKPNLYGIAANGEMVVTPIVIVGQKLKPEGLGVELADAVIRIMDLCEALNIDLSDMIAMKNDYNRTRPYRHGGKKC